MSTPTTKSEVNSKREDYLDWQEYFMATAFLAAKRSKDPCSQVGACIVNENNVIVGIGYNGMPKGCHDEEFPWAKESSNALENKYLYVCHAELNAIVNKNAADVKNCSLYVALFPCNECAKVIIQSGIKEVVYMSDKHAHKIHTVASKRMFDAVGIKYRKQPRAILDPKKINIMYFSEDLTKTPVECQYAEKKILDYFKAFRQFTPKNKKIVIDFSEINWNDMNQLPATPMKKVECEVEQES